MKVSELHIDKELLGMIGIDQAWHYRMLPSHVEGNTLTLVVDESALDDLIKEEIAMQFDQSIAFVLEDSQTIDLALNKYYRRSRERSQHVVLNAGEADVFLDQLIMDAKSLGSSDIHVEAYDEKARVRMRIDGVLIERFTIAQEYYPALINRVKIKANLDIAEKRLPQDGRIEFAQNNDRFDIRVSVLPTLHGEKVVLRLLNRDASQISIESLGMQQAEQDIYLRNTSKPHGLVLISGPTGSGKTTTLYATLKLLNEEKRNILTIEDPIEYTLEGINQVQLKESIGLGFASALRTFLRQDPDIIMVGEIRDRETAEMAIRASLTGHLVLSTIHTNSAKETISRLLDMGVPPFLVANTLNVSVAQRLVRKLCTHCAEEKPMEGEKLTPFLREKTRLPETEKVAVGCDHCYYTGYAGRVAIYEMIDMTPTLSEGVRTGKLGEQLGDTHYRTLLDNALDLYIKRITSFEEIYPILISAEH